MIGGNFAQEVPIFGIVGVAVLGNPARTGMQLRVAARSIGAPLIRSGYQNTAVQVLQIVDGFTPTTPRPPAISPIAEGRRPRGLESWNRYSAACGVIWTELEP